MSGILQETHKMYIGLYALQPNSYFIQSEKCFYLFYCSNRIFVAPRAQNFLETLSYTFLTNHRARKNLLERWRQVFMQAVLSVSLYFSLIIHNKKKIIKADENNGELCGKLFLRWQYLRPGPNASLPVKSGQSKKGVLCVNTFDQITY